MKKFLFAAAIVGSLAVAGAASGKEVQRKSQRYGPTESAACEKAREDAEGRLLGSIELIGIDSCTCGVAAFTKPGASNRYWCRTVAHGRVVPRERPPGPPSTMR